MTAASPGAAETGGGFALYSVGLLSKWGFGDGDCPDEVYDGPLTELGYWDLPSRERLDRFHWKVVLVGLVRDYLLPVLDQRVELIEWYGGYADASHNPARAGSVDGVAVEVDSHFDQRSVPALTPECVTVPWGEVKRRCAAALSVQSPEAATGPG